MGQLFELVNGILVPHGVVNSPFSTDTRSASLASANQLASDSASPSIYADTDSVASAANTSSNSPSPDAQANAGASSTVETQGAPAGQDSSLEARLNAALAKIEQLEQSNKEIKTKFSEEAVIGRDISSDELDAALDSFFS